MFTIAKTWKQPECPSTEEWIKTRYKIQWNMTQPLKRMKSCHLQQQIEEVREGEISDDISHVTLKRNDTDELTK